MIYHLTTRQAWREAQQRGEYRAESLESEGYIHSSTERQILPVAEAFFRGQSGILLLEIDPARLSSELRWEAPSGGTPPPGVPEGDLFPHIYGPINLDAIIKAYNLESDPDGSYKLPTLD